MSEWAYKNCPECGDRTHINFYCSECGGDPWNINLKSLKNIKKLETKRFRLLSKVAEINNQINNHKRNLKYNKS